MSRHLQATYDKMGVEHRVAATIRALDLARRSYSQSLVLGGAPLVVPTRSAAVRPPPTA